MNHVFQDYTFVQRDFFVNKSFISAVRKVQFDLGEWHHDKKYRKYRTVKRLNLLSKTSDCELGKKWREFKCVTKQR